MTHLLELSSPGIQIPSITKDVRIFQSSEGFVMFANPHGSHGRHGPECEFMGPLLRAAVVGLQERSALLPSQRGSREGQSSITLFKGLSRGRTQRCCTEVFCQTPRLQKMKSPAGNFFEARTIIHVGLQLNLGVLLILFHKREPALIEPQILTGRHQATLSPI